MEWIDGGRGSEGGGGYGVMEGGKQWWALTYHHQAFTVRAHLRTWAVGGRTRGGDCAGWLSTMVVGNKHCALFDDAKSRIGICMTSFRWNIRPPE